MESVIALLIGALYAIGIYLFLRRSTIKILLGLVAISNATNLLIFVCAGLVRGRPPIVPQGETMPPAPYADPLAQALILTAIVISFGLLAFAMVLVRGAWRAVGDEDVDVLGEEDR